MYPGTLLLNITVSMHRGPDGVLLLEDQACNGLRLWAENFERLILLAPVEDTPPPPSWTGLEAVGPNLDRIEIVELPVAWRADKFARHLPATAARIRAAIARADYLSLAIGGLFGDWGAVAAIEARRLGKPYAVWTDRVESRVVAHDAIAAPRLRTRLRAQLTHRPMAWLERHVIRRAALGLFHGQDTYDAYAAYARAAEVVHDVHVGAADAIGADALARKAAETEGPLRLVYAGRVEPMKGPMDWIAVLERLAADGIPVEATWIGEGSVLAALRARAAAAGLKGTVHFPGFVSDRSAMLATLRQAHALLFCHLTPESPRILIEALISGTPLLGYDGAFARGLIAGQGGGVLVARGDVTALTAAAAALAADPARRGALIRAAASDGLAFEDAKVFAHRSEVIFRHLGPETAALPSARPAVVAKST